MYRRRFSEALCREIVRRHVEGRGSYRVIARWLHVLSGKKVSATSVQRIVEEVGRRCKSVWEMSTELHPHWNGVILCDEKMCSVQGLAQWFYLAVDSTGDIIHLRAVSELTATEAVKFLLEVKSLPIDVQGIVTDLDTALTRAVEIVYGGKPHQYCTKHALSALEKHIGYVEISGFRRTNTTVLRKEFERLRDRRGAWVRRATQRFVDQWTATRPVSERHKGIAALRDACHEIIFARTKEDAMKLFSKLRGSRKYPGEEKRKAVAFLKRHWVRLTAHHIMHALPRTTNLVENVNKQLERRYKTIEAFQSSQSAVDYTNLLIGYLRQKPYTDCRGERKALNGKSRLGAAGIKNLDQDWIKNCLKKHPK
jgi:transposase-like protein